MSHSRAGEGPHCPAAGSAVGRAEREPSLVCLTSISSKQQQRAVRGRALAVRSGAAGSLRDRGLAGHGVRGWARLRAAFVLRHAVRSMNKAHGSSSLLFSSHGGGEGGQFEATCVSRMKKKNNNHQKKSGLWTRHSLSAQLRLCFLRTRHRLELLPRRLQTSFVPARHAPGTASRGRPALRTARHGRRA